MPRYFFDLADGAEVLRDTEGSEHLSLAAAQIEAAETLTEIGRDVFAATSERLLSIDIRTEIEGVVMRVHLQFRVEVVAPTH